MPAPRKSCPFETASDLRDALVAAGSVDALAYELGCSQGTIRRWCKEAGVETKTGKVGRPIESPYADGASLLAAISDAGSVAALAEQVGRDEKTVRRWMLKYGVRAPRQVRKLDGTQFLQRLSDKNLTSLVSALSKNELADILDLNKTTIDRELRSREITLDDDHTTKNPRVAMLSRRVAELERQESAVRDMTEAVRDAGHFPVPVIPRAKRDKRKTGTPVDVICHVSDVQYGMYVSEEEVPGGGYSPDIVDNERLPRYLEAVEGILAATCSNRPLGTLWIAAGGDHVEGHDVFKGQAWHLAIDAGEQVVRWGRLWAQAVASLARMAQEHGGTSVLLAVNGNHGVQGGRGAGATPVALSHDYLTHALTCEALRPMTKELSLTLHEEPRMAVYFQTCAGIVLMTHGDQDRGGGLVGVPVVTGLRNDYAVRMSTSVQHDIHICGHYHRPTSITIGAASERLWNGAWVGSTNLSIGRGGASLPSQQVLVVHPEYGLSALHRVRLVKGRTESPVEVIEAS